VLRVLSFSTLYPSSETPIHGLFVRERLRALAKIADLRVMVPVLRRPWDFRAAPGPASNPPPETSYHRFINIPRILKGTDASLMARCVETTFAELVRQHRPQVIDAHWAYPDGAAAGRLARMAGLPYTITVRGDDVNCFLDDSARREPILAALRGAARVIAVSADLAECVRREGIEASRVVVASNGVDIERFTPIPRAEARAVVGVPETAPLVLMVGRPSQEKRYELLIEAVAALPEPLRAQCRLAFVGWRADQGTYASRLVKLVEARGLSNQLHLPGGTPPDQLRFWYAAADLLCLASSREGWPNVILEAMACGCPALGTRVGGVSEVIADTAVGALAAADGSDLAALLADCLQRDWDREAIRAYAEQHTWDRTAARCLEILHEAAAEGIQPV